MALKQDGFSGKLESWAKILAGFSAVISAVLIPILLNSYTERNRRMEVFLRTMTEREKSDTDIRQSMFQSLMTGYLGSIKDDFTKEDEGSFRRRIMFLELMTVNFQEFFNTKPLFEDVHRALERKTVEAQTDAEKARWDSLEQQLIRASKNIVARQATMLNNIGTSAVLNIDKGESICVRLYNREDFAALRGRDGSSLHAYESGLCIDQQNGEDVPGDQATGATEPTGDSRRQSLDIRPVSIDRASATVQVGIYEDVFDQKVFKGSLLRKRLSFDLSYFDLPYMDNTKMSDGSRFALVLREVVGNSVEVEAIRFRNDFISLRDRPYFEEMLQKLQTGEVGFSGTP